MKAEYFVGFVRFLDSSLEFYMCPCENFKTKWNQWKYCEKMLQISLTRRKSFLHIFVPVLRILDYLVIRKSYRVSFKYWYREWNLISRGYPISTLVSYSATFRLQFVEKYKLVYQPKVFLRWPKIFLWSLEILYVSRKGEF